MNKIPGYLEILLNLSYKVSILMFFRFKNVSDQLLNCAKLSQWNSNNKKDINLFMIFYKAST